MTAGKMAVTTLPRAAHKAVSQTLYTRDILRLAVSIPHLHRLPSPDGSAELRSPVCGSRIIVDVCLNDTRQVANLGQEVHACALGQASAALMGAGALGKTLADVMATREALAAYLSGSVDTPGDWSGLDIFAAARAHPGRHGAILLPFDALVAAMTDIRA
jgi:NifU-like protein involved in Fe-S cluster formation